MKIMQVNNTMNIGGIESFLMNIYRNINLQKYEFVFLTYNDEKYDFEDEILSLGGKILRISNPNKVSIFRHIYQLYSIMKKEKPDVVHCHTHFNCAYVMFAAACAGIKIRITHSHSTYAKLEKRLIKRIKWFFSRKIINFFSTNKLACSTEAGEALYNDHKFIVIPNGIDLEKYSFSESKRKELRKKYKIDDNCIVIGHVGRLDIPKNHMFLLEIFKCFLMKNENTKLILVGSGPLENKIKNYIEKAKINDKVIMMGNRNDVYDIYNMFDIFIFPSLYEGLPVTLVEAQANGLQIFASDNISHEIKISENLNFYNLKNTAEQWANNIYYNYKERIESNVVIKNSIYSINNTINELVKIYGGDN